MHINGKKMTAEGLMRMVLIKPTDTPEQKAKMEEAIQRSSKKSPCIICDMPTTQELCEKCYLETK